MKIALAHTTLDAPEPTDEAKKMGEAYIAGKIELDDALKATIARYQKEPAHE